MKVIPLTIKEANRFIRKYHRHNAPVTTGRFAIGAQKNGKLVGVAIAGNPVARLLCDGETLEVLRVCTDGTKNVNSFLYQRVKRIAQLMGYKKVITYTLQNESGSSLKAIGAEIESEVKPSSWNRPNRPRKEQEVYKQKKFRWRL